MISDSQVALVMKNPTCQRRRFKRQVRSLGWENPLEKGMATHSSILAWRILRAEEPGGPQSVGSQRVRHDWNDLACTLWLVILSIFLCACWPSVCLLWKMSIQILLSTGHLLFSFGYSFSQFQLPLLFFKEWWRLMVYTNLPCLWPCLQVWDLPPCCQIG